MNQLNKNYRKEVVMNETGYSSLLPSNRKCDNTKLEEKVIENMRKLKILIKWIFRENNIKQPLNDKFKRERRFA